MASDPSVEEQEVILDESVSSEARRIRVYDSKGDFVIDVPAGTRMTFGYFNPASPKFDSRGGGAWNDQPSAVARASALRLYGPGKDNQLACFLGVKGFRDEAIKLTRLSQRVVIETNLNDDGEGNIEHAFKQQRQLVASPEPDTYS